MSRNRVRRKSRASRYSTIDLAEAMQRPLARARSFADVLQLIAMGMEREGDENAPAIVVIAESLMDDLDIVQNAWGRLYHVGPKYRGEPSWPGFSGPPISRGHPERLAAKGGRDRPIMMGWLNWRLVIVKEIT